MCPSILLILLTDYQQEYTVINKDVTSIRPALFNEAQMLYKGESSNDLIVSVAAIGLFGAACLFEGWDTLGVELSIAGRGMAERLELIGPSAAAVAEKMQRDKPSDFVRVGKSSGKTYSNCLINSSERE